MKKLKPYERHVWHLNPMTVVELLGGFTLQTINGIINHEIVTPSAIQLLARNHGDEVCVFSFVEYIHKLSLIISCKAIVSTKKA